MEESRANRVVEPRRAAAGEILGVAGWKLPFAALSDYARPCCRPRVVREVSCSLRGLSNPAAQRMT